MRGPAGSVASSGSRTAVEIFTGSVDTLRIIGAGSDDLRRRWGGLDGLADRRGTLLQRRHRRIGAVQTRTRAGVVVGEHHPYESGCDRSILDDRQIAQLIGDLPGAAVVLLRHPHLRSEEHTSELQSRENLVCRLLL